MRRVLACLVIALAGPAAFAQSAERPAAPVVRINPPGALDPGPPQPDRAYQPQERDRAMAEKPANGCACESNNRCYHSRDFNYCIAKDGRKIFLQRYW